MSEPVFSHTGQRYVLGYDDDVYAIWDRQSPGPRRGASRQVERGVAAGLVAVRAAEPAAAPVGGSAASAPGYAAPQYGPPHMGSSVPAVRGLSAGPSEDQRPWRSRPSCWASSASGSPGGHLLGPHRQEPDDKSGGTQGGRGLAVAGIALGTVWMVLGLTFYASLSGT